MKHKAHSVQNKTAAARNHSAMPPDNHIADYWLERLASACKQAHVDTACLGITNHGSSIAVSYSHSAAPDHSSANPYPAFCVAKLFTSTLIALLVMQGKLQFDAEITGLLPATSTAGVASTVLHGVTVAQLLAHTHGLCALGLDAAPVQADGFIDYEHVLCLLHSSGRMFAPGKFYSYGMAGYVVLGSIIEHITRQTYNQVLHQQILLPIATRGTHLPDVGTCTASRPICPSSGRGLHLTPGDLLAFASGFLTPLARVLNLPDALLAQIFTTRKLLPGWSPTIAGSCYGWKNFANNWYGQNGIDNKHLMYVRINRATETAICLSTRADKRRAAALPSLLFQHDFPELTYSSARQPAILADVPADNFSAIIGTYGNCLSNFTIGLKNSRLVVDISSINAGQQVISHQCYLYPAEDNISFLAKPWQNITFLQLVTDNNSARYLWDHTQLWPALAG